MRPLLRATWAVLGALGGATGAFAQDNLDQDDASGIDWSVALRGSYASNTLTGGKAELLLNPQASYTFTGESSRSTIGADAAFVVDGADLGRFSSAHASAQSAYRLGALTTLEGSADVTLSQLSPDDSSLPANTLMAPLELDGKVRGSVTQDMGRLDVRATVDGQRYLKGETTLDDLSTVSNWHQSFWDGGATMRVGYELTPLLSAFVEGEASYQKFDAPSPTVLAYLDGATYQLRGGMSYAQGSVVSAEASIGYGWLDYTDVALTDAPSWVYNASLTVRPDETLSLVGAFETDIGPSTDVPGDTDVTYAANGTLRYDVNPWLSLRSSAGWQQAVTLGTGDVAWGVSAGAGLDYRSSRHVVWTADYAFQREDAPPTPRNDTHTVSVGVRVQR